MLSGSPTVRPNQMEKALKFVRRLAIFMMNAFDIRSPRLPGAFNKVDREAIWLGDGRHRLAKLGQTGH